MAKCPRPAQSRIGTKIVTCQQPSPIWIQPVVKAGMVLCLVQPWRAHLTNFYGDSSEVKKRMERSSVCCTYNVRGTKVAQKVPPGASA